MAKEKKIQFFYECLAIFDFLGKWLLNEKKVTLLVIFQMDFVYRDTPGYIRTEVLKMT